VPLLSRGATDRAPSRGCDSILKEDFELELELHREADREANERDLELGAGDCAGEGGTEGCEGESGVGPKGEGKGAGV